jgi:hypothetical protein
MTIREFHAEVRKLAGEYHENDYSQVDIKTDQRGDITFGCYISGPGWIYSDTLDKLFAKIKGNEVVEDMVIDDLPFTDSPELPFAELPASPAPEVFNGIGALADGNSVILPLEEKQPESLAELDREVFPGEKVYFWDGKENKDNGIIKSTRDENSAYVVYSCDGDWDNYGSYDGELTFYSQLFPGWV